LAGDGCVNWSQPPWRSSDFYCPESFNLGAFLWHRLPSFTLKVKDSEMRFL
jgi:hypothetical protein